MCTAANALIDADGGIVVVIDNRVAAIIPLPLAGLMTLNTAALIVLEQLHITNRGKRKNTRHPGKTEA
jgi:adenine deaminase